MTFGNLFLRFADEAIASAPNRRLEQEEQERHENVEMTVRAVAESFGMSSFL